jgi:4-hydroxybenzoyl-CoA thioesterase
MTAVEDSEEKTSRFCREELVRFQHCDPAGIVFYPRYIEMINATVEDWFAQVIGITFADIHITQSVAMPIVALNVEFNSPAKLGDMLRFDIAVLNLGRTSINLVVSARRDMHQILKATLTLVFVSKSDHRPRPWPDDYRRRIGAAVSGV